MSDVPRDYIDRAKAFAAIAAGTKPPRISAIQLGFDLARIGNYSRLPGLREELRAIASGKQRYRFHAEIYGQLIYLTVFELQWGEIRTFEGFSALMGALLGDDIRPFLVSLYYAWRTRPESSRTKSDRQLMAEIRRAHQDSKGVYGSPRVHAELVANGIRVCRHKVARLMRLARLRGCPKRRFRVTTQRDPSHPVAKKFLRRNFSSDVLNQRWAVDITYIPTHQGWLYLAVVMDLYSRRIVGWSMSRWMSRRIVVDALRMAIDARRPEGPLIHHSDRGGQYTSDDFRDELASHGIDCSMSSSGNCYDNAAVESFFGLLKRERVNRVRYRTRDEA